MSVHKLEFKQTIHQPIKDVWKFFSNPNNLAIITPPEIGFKQTHNDYTDIYAGMILQHRIKPIFNIPLSWMTEITQVKHSDYFIDEQRKGIYNFWHHQHHFKETNTGTEMLDIVHYEVPFGFLGDIVDAIFVRNKIQSLFDYRYKKIEEIFSM